MDTITITNAFQAVTLIFAVAAVTTGLQAITNPISFATSFGIPLSQPAPRPKPPPKSKAAPRIEETSINPAYVKVMGARQLGTGITLLVFAYQGKWVESATVLAIIGVVVAGTDGYYIAKNGSLGGGLFHAGPGALIAALAVARLRVGG
jgi:hypothetical protein